jgi:broad specificity phosphatase PhoE
MSRVYLLRHAEVEAPWRGLLLGRTDAPPDATGVQRFARIGQLLRERGVGAAFTSPLLRARACADALGFEAHVIPGLAEIDFGEWEGKSFRDVPRAVSLYEDPASAQIPGGESFEWFATRVREAIHAILLREPERPTAVVSHGVVNRVILAEAMGLAHKRMFRIAQDPGCINLVDYGAGWRCVRLLNARTL